MQATRELLTQSLAYGALIAAVLEYAIVVRHRAERRAAKAQIDEAGLEALVRVMLTDEWQPTGPARYLRILHARARLGPIGWLRGRSPGRRRSHRRRPTAC